MISKTEKGIVTSLILKGRIPSKKNSKRIVTRGRYGRLLRHPKLLSSKEHDQWHYDASWELASQKKQVGIQRCSIELMFYMPDMRSADLTNKAESIMDLLVDSKIIVDDNWHVVSPVVLDAQLDKENPRVEIKILNLNS